MDRMIDHLRKIPVCELDGKLHRVQRILPAEVMGRWQIGSAAGSLHLASSDRVFFHEGGTLTQAELLSAREIGPGRWLLQGQDGNFRTLGLFSAQPGASCLIKVDQGGQTRRLYRQVCQLVGPDEQIAPSGREVAIPQ